MRKILSGIIISGLVVLAIPFSASAATISVGNDSTSRAIVDTATNFVIIDTNHPVSANGYLNSFSYYASNTNVFRFILVNSSNAVKWVSGEITPSATGVNTYTPAVPVSVESGWNLGVYFKTTGTIPFEATGALAHYRANDSGLPAVNDTLTYAGSSNRTYSFVATGTTELPGTLHAEDFGVVNYDVGSGLGWLKGYTSGFGLTDATFAGATSVVVKLYSGGTLLQTNTATAKFKTDIIGTQFSSPFDIFGTFNYTTDGYWVNVRETEYGQNLLPTKVRAFVVLANGKEVVAVNTNPTGDPTTIYPTTPPPIGAPTTKDQCKKNGWKIFSNPIFRNQGQCVSYVNGRAANHGQTVKNSTDKKAAAQSTTGMPPKSQKGKNK